MIDVDEDVLRSRRLTWFVGGILLIIAGLTWCAVQLASAPLGWLGLVTEAAALIVFAVGIGRAGSVTARRPLGTFALAGLGVWVIVGTIARVVLTAAVLPRGADAADQLVMMHRLVWTATDVITLVLAVIAGIEIIRARAVPAPWRWMPLAAVVLIVAGRGLQLLVPSLPLNMLWPASAVAGIVLPATQLLLGIVAVALAASSTRRATAAALT